MSEGEYRPLTEAEKKKLPMDIHVSVDSKQFEEQAKRIVELEPKSKAFEKISEELASKCREHGIECDSSDISDFESFQEHVEMLNQIRERQEKANSKGASGVVELPTRSDSLTRSGSSEEFSSIEELVDHIRSLTDQTDQNSPEKKEAEAVLNELWRKTIKGLKEQPSQLGYDPNQQEQPESAVQHAIEAGKRKRGRKNQAMER